MEVTVSGPVRTAERASEDAPLVKRHSLATRLTHWTAALALLVLVMSGLQIFNAAPYLDASDKSDPSHRVFAVAGGTLASGAAVGTVTLFGRTFRTTHVLGYTDDGQGGQTARAFPGWLTLPGYQDLAGGRRWHLFFAWIFVACGLAYALAGALHKDLRLLLLRPSDLPKLWPMQAYYFRLRPNPPPHGKYNPLQKLAYTVVLFVLGPLVVLSGLALSPGVDAIAGPLTTLFGGRQFARLWHFVFMLAFIGFFFGHMVLVATTGIGNNLRSMVTGRYRPHPGEGTGP
jgi:thiosulfate reductase cytochrome b subunit